MPESSLPGPFTIKNFGVEVECRSLSEVITVLGSHFRNKSVSIVYPKPPNGLLSTVFVDVGSDGSVRHSYGDQKEFSPQDLEA